MARVKIFDWPDANREMPNRRWLPTAGPDAQHRYWTTTDGWISCIQDYTPEDYEEVMAIAEISSVLDHMLTLRQALKIHLLSRSSTETKMPSRSVAYSFARREKY